MPTHSTVDIPQKTVTDPVQLDQHVTFQWLYDAKAFRVAITSSQRTAIDAYIGANQAVLEDWRPEQHFFSVQDISHRDVTITPYFRDGLENISQTIDELGIHGDSVILLESGLMGRIVQIYGRTFARKTSTVTQHWFTDEAKGIAHLENLMRAADSASQT